MGHLQATEMAELLPMEEAIAWHLSANHYPPVPQSMVQPCMEAIDAYWEDELDKMIELPKPVKWKGRSHAPARVIIIQHHLDAWCAEVEEEFEEE